MEQEFRKKAIKRYLQGETPKSIYSNLGRSKNWFFKWPRRYQSGDSDLSIQIPDQDVRQRSTTLTSSG